MRSAIFWNITQRQWQSFTDVSEQHISPVFKSQEVQEFLSLEDGTDILSRNVGKGLPLTLSNTPQESRSQDLSTFIAAAAINSP
jgi:hypothetical protein